MWVFLGGLLEAIADFVTDVWLRRRVRAKNKRPENSWQKDAAEVAYVDWVVTPAVMLAAVAGFLVLFYLFGCSFGVSLFWTLGPAGLYCAYRWFKVLNT
ncbi:hypothetical protein [Pseudomonas sp. GV071]|jgi:hypothetical protein|uniref:hypothetical protein n=1 Tax=Pseudomonas sp. GV071 TaxID=2135754 RepID=UPI000D36E645|nr:hypothetical protein [Pseudomonas sp. GV071]PTQ66950.1 hypothetical protein C8K61_11890 [Pseudomonas sp. GV071]